MSDNDRRHDERQLHALLAQLAERWDQGDAEGYAALFEPDARYVAFDGSRMDGRQAIAAAHKPLFERFLRGSRLRWDEIEISFPSPDTAVLHTRGAVLRRAESKPARSRTSVQTIVAVRRAGEFRLVAFQNTRYRPFDATLLGKLLKSTFGQVHSTSGVRG